MSMIKQPVVQQPVNKDNICAVVTTYRSSGKLVENIKRIVGQVGIVVIVDDSGLDENFQHLRLWLSDIPRVEIVRQWSNSGVAAALNRGVFAAREKGYPWILALDDDTLVEPDLVSNTIKSWRALSASGGKPLAIIGMSHRDSHTGSTQHQPSDTDWFLEKRAVITSGSLFSLHAYDTIGPFREEFFIDSVDYDFCLRARAIGYRVVQVCALGMIHSLGCRTRHRLGWFFVETTNHTPVRRYYMFRNSLVLAWEYCLHDPLYSLAVVYFKLKTLMLVLLFEDNKYNKIKMMSRGVVHAFTHSMGKCPWDNL